MRGRLTLILLGALALPACGGPSPYRIYADFADVGDLVNRSNVQQSDTVVGRVTAIRLRGLVARVEMEIQPGVRVPVGSRAVVRSTSLLGEKFVDLQPPEGVTAQTPALRDGALIPLDRTSKTPELEEVFSQLGHILASGGLTDFGRFVSAMARVVEGQEEQLGRVLDGTAKLVASLAAQREPLAQALEHLAAATRTFASGTETIQRFLSTSAEVGRILEGQTAQLQELFVQLDRLGQSGARLIRDHQADMDAAIKLAAQIVGDLRRTADPGGDLDRALGLLPTFARLFADSVPGDYVQLNTTLGGLPVPLPGASAPGVPPPRGGSASRIPPPGASAPRSASPGASTPHVPPPPPGAHLPPPPPGAHLPPPADGPVGSILWEAVR